MKKRGTTLIELSVALALIVIIIVIGSKGYLVYEQIFCDIKIKQFLYDIEDTLCYGKEYCYFNSRVGEFYIEQDKDSLKVIFKNSDGIKREINLEDSIRLVKDDWTTEITNRSLTISNRGYIQSETINFIDQRGGKYMITVRPGGNLITVKEE